MHKLHLLIVTRGRPQQLMRLMNSIAGTANQPDLLDIYIYIDDDDHETLALIDHFKALPFAINPCIFPRIVSQGGMVESLIRECNADTGVYLPLPDDYIFGKQGWDTDILNAYWLFPDHYGLFYPIDPSVPAGQVTFLFLSAQWVKCLGKVATNFFPFWFDDNWVDEVAQMVQRKIPISTIMIPPGGRGQTPRMRNLPFWQNYYNCLFDERLNDAAKIRNAIWKSDENGIKSSEIMAAECFSKFAQSGSSSDESLLEMERNISPNFGEDRTTIPESYLKIEKTAVAKLQLKASYCLEIGDIPRAVGILATICKAYTANNECAQRFLEAQKQFPNAFRGNIAETQYRKVHHDPINPLLSIHTEKNHGKIFQPIQKGATAVQFDFGNIIQQAIAYAQLGEWSKCCDLLETCSRTSPQIFKQPNLCYTFAVALLRMGRKQEAYGLASQELRDNPKHQEAKNLLFLIRK